MKNSTRFTLTQAHVLSVPSVSLIEGRPATTSLDIAEHFGKRHDHVCRDIRRICAETPEKFHVPNFGEMSRTVKIGNGAERQELYFTVFFDGFILLVMGYTGKKALTMKLAYIEAFNAMREELEAKAEPLESSDQSPSSLISLTPSSVSDRKPLRSLVNAWARVSGQPFDACWSQLKAAFRLTDIRDLPQEWIPDAIAWVQAKIDVLPKALPSAPAPERLPMYRNGAFYPPHINKAHIPGPSEAALMALWKDWPRREKVISDAFNALMDDIRKYQGDSFPHLVSDMGRNADTMFGVDCLLEGLYCAQTSAISNFKRALELARLHLRLAVNVAVVQGR